MMKKLRKLFAKVLFALYKKVQISVEDRYNETGLRYLIGLELPKDYDYKKRSKCYSPYFKKWGLKVPMVCSDYYSKMSGIESDTYLPRNILFNYIYPYLARYEFCPAYADKNIEARVLNIKKVQKTVDVLLPRTIVCNMNGNFFDEEDNEITQDEAIKILISYKEDMIMKPAVGSYGGVGVIKIKKKDNISEQGFQKLLDKYKSDYVIQEVVIQHPDLSTFNESSVNTMRIVTYRRPNKERKVLYRLIRFGANGAINDNVCSGGGFSLINPDGTMKDRIVHVYKTWERKILPANVVQTIPYFDKVITAALALHGQLPHFDIMGWDFTITPDGHPVLIEYNIRPGSGLQSGVGPMFSKEDLDEIMPNVMKHQKGFRITPYLSFVDKKGFDSKWDC